MTSSGQEEIEEAETTTSDTEQTTTEEEEVEADGEVEPTAVSSKYKILGENDADDGTGILGRNKSSSSTATGVEGTVPNSSGYGLYTPDNAKMDGRVGIGGDFVSSARLLVEGDSDVDDELLRVRDGGSTKLFVDKNGGTTIGKYFEIPPTDGLYVNGNTILEDGTTIGIGSNKSPTNGLHVDGDTGLGTTSPEAKLHVNGAGAGDAFNSPSEHVMYIENTLTDDSSNGLAIENGSSSDPSNNANFISFYDGSGDSVGAIEGNGSGGTTRKSTGSDYAEYLPLADPDREFEAGDVVGVSGGTLVADAATADRAMVVSEAPIVAGNDPGGDASGHEKVAFTGQVPVDVRGPVRSGDMIVPSGDADGTAVAISPAEWTPGEGPVVGQVWEDDTSEQISEVTVAVGIDDPTVLGGRIDELESELDQKDERIDELEARLSAVEAQIGPNSTVPADD